MRNGRKDVVVMGGGLAGLSAAYVLSNAGREVTLIESDRSIGGLARTVVHGDFRFDLGGHRIFTKNREIEEFIKNLLGDELLLVPRKSTIYLKNRYFNYPLKPLNAIGGLGVATTARILLDYGAERLKSAFKNGCGPSLEDWVVRNFGRAMFDLYFREYSEKVWGLDCKRISRSWVAKRIEGLSLWRAVKNAFFKYGGSEIPTLIDKFAYPELGIGRLADKLGERLMGEKRILTETTAKKIIHDGRSVEALVADNCSVRHTIEAREFVSSIPLTAVLNALDPAPPGEILSLGSKLRYRDLVIAAVIVDKEKVTDQSWVYIPERDIPFGRIHEPKNWSGRMAPKGSTLLVIEYFCFAGDSIWGSSDDALAAVTAENLERLGFVKRDEVKETVIVRVPKAYPLFEVGYEEVCDRIYDYLSRFENLHLIGRTGMFRYYNMDHALESGMHSAKEILSRN